MKLLILPLLALVTLLNSCSLEGTHLTDHTKFQTRKDYQKTFDSFESTSIAVTKQTDTRILVNKATQRIQLIDRDQIVLDAPCSTGREGKNTPVGDFKISEKIAKKKSTLYGSCYKDGVKVYRGDRRECKVQYNNYVGASLPHWQRLTYDGIGIHASNSVQRHPSSNGCIRLQPNIAKLIFDKTHRGTKVTIIN